MPDDGELTIKIDTEDGAVTLSGWTNIALTRGIENFPSSFDIGLTEKYPGKEEIGITPGRGCKVYIGGDLVLTGYVDRYQSSITDATHDVRISGRSLCEDLVDCSAYFGEYGEGYTMLTNRILMDIAHQLCDPFNISVENLSGDDGPKIPVVMINLGETVYEILEKVARWEGLLIYDTPEGHLVFNRVGQESMASGFHQGMNVQAGNAEYTADERFTDYYVLRQEINGFKDLNNAQKTAGNNRHGYAYDKQLKALGRYRPHYIVSNIIDQFQELLGYNTSDLGQRMADWEMNRRWGRAQVVTVVADSWRDKSGALWEPNKLAIVDMPAIKVSNRNWIIASVTYHRDIETGTTAQVVMMPPEAFKIEPVALIQGSYADLLHAQTLAQAPKNQALINSPPSVGGNPAETGFVAPPPPTAAAAPPQEVPVNPASTTLQTAPSSPAPGVQNPYIADPGTPLAVGKEPPETGGGNGQF